MGAELLMGAVLSGLMAVANRPKDPPPPPQVHQQVDKTVPEEALTLDALAEDEESRKRKQQSQKDKFKVDPTTDPTQKTTQTGVQIGDVVRQAAQTKTGVQI